MTTLKVSCPTCGPLEIPASAMLLFVSNVPERQSYAFTCPTCTDRCVRVATDEIVKLLDGVEVQRKEEHVPEEMLEEHTGRVLTQADLDAFVSALTDDEFPSATAEAWM